MQPDQTIEIEDQQAVLQDLGPLTGLPGDARYRPVVGKSPSHDGWNSDPSLWLTAEQVLKERALGGRWTGIGLLTGRKVGRLCWLDFDGEEFDAETGELRKSASLDFEFLTGMAVEQLPPCPISISGRPGRFRALFRMPEDWADYFHGFSITSSELPTKGLEFLYEKAGGKLFHAVVEGLHPDGQGWYYRWKEGCSPAEVEIPDLPARVVAGLVRHIAKKSWARVEHEQTEQVIREGGEAGPMDLLSPGKQRQCLRLMQKFWPYRGGEAGTGFAGHYDVMRRLVLSLVKGVDDLEVLLLWLEGGSWDKRNDWGGVGTSAPVTGGELKGFATSLSRSDTAGPEVMPWSAAWSLAVSNGWKPPKWALPPRVIDSSSLQVNTKKKVEELTKAMAVEFGPAGIRINTVGPTFIVTEMTRPYFEDEAFRTAVLSKIKLGRLGQVTDLMGAVVFLASDASALMTGSAMLVDGGWTAE
jgi:NAD(P)-dependent dehydrogenase (short-subunit alcohol dehydrogenase family)